MASKTTYTCDICHREIQTNEVYGNNKPTAFAFEWMLNAHGPDELKCAMFYTAPFHLCSPCVKAIGDAASRLIAEGKL